MRKLIRFRWPLSDRGRGKRKDSCYIEPIEIASTLSAKHCGDQTADCSNGVLEMEYRAVCTPDYEEKHQNGRRIKDEGEPMFTLTAQDRHGVAIYDSFNKKELKEGIVGTLTANGNTSVTHSGTFLVGKYSDVRIRRLTPREVWRLQGFPDEYFDKAAAVISDTQLYRAAGNAVTVNVARAIGKRLKEIEDEET